ncbi:ADP-ribosylation/crystallin J1, partial [Streptomyces violaceoruber]
MTERRTESGTTTLWRPTGPEELALVEASGWTA